MGEIGDPARQEHLALGETPNIAFRQQVLAAPGSVVISEATHRLVARYFICEPLGPQTLKGYPQPQMAYRVLGVHAAQNRVDVAALGRLTPLVGRSQEVGLMLERWEQARDAMGQIVVLSGEAGIGKSRLVYTLKNHVSRDGYLQLAVRCSPYQQHTALYPIAALLRELLQWEEADSPEVKQAKLEHALRRARLGVEESMLQLISAFVPLLLSNDVSLAPVMEPEQQRQQLFAIMAELLRAVATDQPVLVIVEDLHWSDPSTLDFLEVLIAQTPTVPMLLVMTCRSDFPMPWVMRPSITQLTLSRLSRKSITAMVTHLVSDKSLPNQLLDYLISQTDGVPLFIEELTKTVLESRALVETDDSYALTQPVEALAIPTTLHDVLMARLDRLGSTKEIAQLGAVIGRQFSYALLQALSPREPAELQQGLTELVGSELLYQQGLPPQSIYQFKHALVQEAAYQSLLRRVRRQLHQHLFKVIEAHFPDMAETQPEVMAHHATAGGLHDAAVRYWQQAGQRAKQRSANREAIAHLNQGLEVLSLLPKTHARLEQELALHIALGTALQATKGITAPEVGQLYTQARELCQQIGDTPQLFPVLLGLWWYHQHNPKTAQALAEELLDVSHRWNDPTLRLQAHHASWTTAYFHGDWTTLQHHAEQGLSLFTPQDHHTYVAHSYHDPGVCGLSMSSHALWLLGYPDQAMDRSHQALQLAQDLSHAYSHGLALVYAAELCLRRGDAQTGEELAHAALALSKIHEFFYLQPYATLLQGRA